jgi:hypothetical protein
MIQIEGIDALDGSTPTEQGVDLMRMIHEGMDMGCWHLWGREPRDGTPWHNHWCCKNCESLEQSFMQNPHEWRDNPSYLTSLDALRPLWDKMSGEQWGKFQNELHRVISNELNNTVVIEPIRIPHPHHHVEALARCIEVECPECDGGGQVLNELESASGCPSCSGTGKRTIISIWKEKESQ